MSAVRRCVFAILLLPAFTAGHAGAQPAAGSAQSAPAPQPSPTEWQYGGFVDAGYLRDFNDPPNHLFRSRGTTFRVDEWDVNMAGAYLKKKASPDTRWGAELAVHAGKDGEVFGFSPTAPNLAGADWIGHLGAANVSYLAAAGPGLTLQGGIFSSFIGYDSLYARDNFNYTRPWSADFTPYLMMGVNGSYAVTAKAAATVFVVNGYWHLAGANDAPSAGGQLAYQATPRVTVKQTVLVGPHQANTSPRFWRWLSDSIVERRGERVVAALELQTSTERVDETGNRRALWMSAQLPVRWQSRERWTVAVRPEAAWDSSGRYTAHEQSVKALTTTFEYRVPYGWAGAILRLEYRFDDSRGSDGGFFRREPGVSGTTGLTPSQHLLILGVIVTLDSSAARPPATATNGTARW